MTREPVYLLINCAFYDNYVRNSIPEEKLDHILRVSWKLGQQPIGHLSCNTQQGARGTQLPCKNRCVVVEKYFCSIDKLHSLSGSEHCDRCMLGSSSDRGSSKKIICNNLRNLLHSLLSSNHQSLPGTKKKEKIKN